MLLDWAFVFLILALIAGFFGFSGVAVESAGIAKILFLIFLAVFVISFLYRMMTGKTPPSAP